MTMTPYPVFTKTEKGLAELRSRALRLAPPLRALLIMVDGTSDLRQLTKKAEGLPGMPDSLHRLLAEGLIEEVRQASAARVAHATGGLAPVRTSAPIAPSSRRRSVALARLYLMDILERTLGPVSEPVRNRLRLATDRAGVVDALADIRPVLHETIGAERLARIEAEFLGLLPDAPN